ncbi:nucleotidyltransferase domain-containing protein [Microcoleus sp. N9_B2]|uniref:nucleotidyltransferase domain-containing protein n=1 Tax=unclassified Microcoleus TaxID=2642155 RepID=UPI002FD444A7
MVELQSDLEYVVTDRLKVSLDAIARFCQRWNIVEFALFGSVLRDDFRPDSNVDVLVAFENLSSDLSKRAIGIALHFGIWRKQLVGFRSLRLISFTVS